MLTEQRNRSGVSIPRSALRAPRFRRGFTLVEMLVVIAIIVFLMAMVLAFYPKREVRLAAQGADQLQTYIAASKSRAMRDNIPCGIRLNSTDGGATFRTFEVVQVPEPFIPFGATMSVSTFTPNTATFSVDVSASVQRGDLLEITHGSGSIHRVTGFTAPNQVILASNVPAAAITDLNLSQNFRFIRQPRPLMGETPLQLPNNVYVDHDSTLVINGIQGKSINFPFNSWTNQFEIVFSPSGQVINANAGQIILWMADDNNVSAPTLLAIYAFTGGVASHPIGPAPDYYQYTRDGRSSGQ